MKQVNPSIYSKEYFLTTCLGSEEFSKSNGKILHPRIKKLLDSLSITSSMTVLDIGCGRGDISLYLGGKAKEVIGIDYAKDAIEIANEIKKTFPKSIQKKASFYKMNGKKLSFDDNTFDYIIAIDLFEHLYKDELEKSIKEMKRVLKPDGILFVHTGTNRLLYEYVYKYYTYPVNKLLTSFDQLIKRTSYPSLPKDPRTPAEKVQHVNEPTYLSLRSLFKKFNFSGKIDIEIGYIKEKKNSKTSIYNMLIAWYPLSRYLPFSLFFGWVFICRMRNSK